METIEDKVDNTPFLVTAGLSLATAALDARGTVEGLAANVSAELNPLALMYIDDLGPNSLFLYKALMQTTVVTAAYALYHAEKIKTSLGILLGSAVLQGYAATVWYGGLGTFDWFR